MSREIIYSFKEYQDEYPRMLNSFCKNKEFDEGDFIATEIDFHRIYLTSVSIYKRIRYRSASDPMLDEDLFFLTANNRIYEIIADTIKSKAKSVEVDNIIASCKIHFNKIISFLEAKKSECEIELRTLVQLNSTLEHNTIIDLSDTSAVKKIIYLNELGIIDFLKKQPCFISNNKLSNVLTAITGEKHTTIQPLVNALINDSGQAKHKPYNNKFTVNKVKKQLTDLGFKS